MKQINKTVDGRLFVGSFVLFQFYFIMCDELKRRHLIKYWRIAAVFAARNPGV